MEINRSETGHVQVVVRAAVNRSRKVPVDLTEGSICGTILTIVCYILVAALVTLEFNNYFTIDSEDFLFHLFLARTDYVIEQHDDEFIRINFDITMKSLSCDLASLDIVNQMGTHRVIGCLRLIQFLDQCHAKHSSLASF